LVSSATLAKLKTPMGVPTSGKSTNYIRVKPRHDTLTSLEAELLRGSYLPASDAKTSL